MIIRDTDLDMLEALFVTVKEVLLKPFLTISTTFINQPIFTRSYLDRISFNIVET